MKRVVLLIVASLACAGARSQSLVDWSSPAYGRAWIPYMVGASEWSPQSGALAPQIVIVAESSAADALRGSDAAGGRTQVMAYGVSLLRDNSQNARANAYGIASRFGELFPGIGVEVRYDSPWFTVTAGRFVDRTDAVALCGRVLSQFPKAMVMQRESSTAQIIDTYRKAISTSESEE